MTDTARTALGHSVSLAFDRLTRAAKHWCEGGGYACDAAEDLEGAALAYADASGWASPGAHAALQRAFDQVVAGTNRELAAYTERVARLEEALREAAELVVRIEYDQEISTHDGWHITNPRIEWPDKLRRRKEAWEERARAALSGTAPGATRAELVEALKLCRDWWDGNRPLVDSEDARRRVRAVLAKEGAHG